MRTARDIKAWASGQMEQLQHSALSAHSRFTCWISPFQATCLFYAHGSFRGALVPNVGTRPDSNRIRVFFHPSRGYFRTSD